MKTRTFYITFKNELNVLETTAMAVNLAMPTKQRVIGRTGLPVQHGIVDQFDVAGGNVIRIFNDFDTITIETDLGVSIEDVQDALLFVSGYHMYVESF